MKEAYPQSPSGNDLAPTGERFLPDKMNGDIKLEHLHRYFLACRLAKGKSVLDIASGDGYGSDLLAQVADNVIGVDLSEQAISHAKTRYSRDNLEFRQGDCVAIPLEDRTVDLIVSFETLEHHDRHEDMLWECRRILKPGGILIMSTPDKLVYTDIPNTKNPFHAKELYLAEFRELLERHFPNVVLHGQRICYGSVIASLDGLSDGYTTITGHIGDLSTFPGVSSPVYAVALASDQAVPVFTASIFDNTERFLALHRQALLDQIQLERTLQEVTRMKSSVSWQVTKPLRLLAFLWRKLAHTSNASQSSQS